MSDPNETIADIVREIRAAAYIQNADTPESVIAFADRIEVAAKRELDEARKARDEARETAEEEAEGGNRNRPRLHHRTLRHAGRDRQHRPVRAFQQGHRNRPGERGGGKPLRKGVGR